MELKELRVGNIVSITPYGENDLLKLDQLSFESLIIFKTFDRIKPVPLTEYWLFKFGFKNNELNAKHNIFVWYENHIGIKGMLGIVKPCKCIYVHQLQNLYFALTGQELTLK